MADVMTLEQRRRNMSAIRSAHTKPEMVVRSLLHRLGYRFRLHRRNLPGKPDLVFPSRRKVIFIHGCFWHRHNCRYGKPVPATRTEFWQEKFEQNKARDKRVERELQKMGWDVLVVWECQTKSGRLEWLVDRVVSFLDGN